MTDPAPIHLKPQTELATRVLLPGDPHRALAVAQAVLEAPRMFNHHRGLWGYTGMSADGHPVTVQSTGMGGPSAAIVVQELIILGARISFYLPTDPLVPITLQTFGVLFGGALLGFRRALMSVALYLLLGIVGLPVFALDQATGV
ncbi:MAG: biotin transporter BioY, partial [Thermoleophilaceae bacterium]